MSLSQSHKTPYYDPQVLLNAQPVIVTVIDPATYKIMIQNRISIEKFGDISGETCHDKIVACSSPCGFCKMPEAVQSGHITASEIPLPDDEYLLVQWVKAETTDGQVHVVETITDITESKRQQKDAENLNRQLQTANHELQSLNRFLTEHSVRDGLTGLYNHAYFMEMLRQMGEQATRSREPLSLLFVDCDNFKRINDTFGHTVGDQVLGEIGGLLNGRLAREDCHRMWRASDVCARYDGDEFGILLPNTSADNAMALAELIRASMRDLALLQELAAKAPRHISWSCSIGVATFPTHATINELLHAADTALYAAKHSGKNRVEVFDREQSARVLARAGDRAAPSDR